ALQLLGPSLQLVSQCIQGRAVVLHHALCRPSDARRRSRSCLGVSNGRWSLIGRLTPWDNTPDRVPSLNRPCRLAVAEGDHSPAFLPLRSASAPASSVSIAVTMLSARRLRQFPHQNRSCTMGTPPRPSSTKRCTLALHPATIRRHPAVR